MLYMANDAFDLSVERGRDLAKAKQDRFHRLNTDTWIVPSATGSDFSYLVNTARSTCTCGDAASGAKCMHLWAAAFLQNDITLIDGTRLAPPPLENAEDLVAPIYVHGWAS
jgi:hypothetical protein